MARFLALINLLFLLFSCGQIGSISGGPKDEVAPQIVQGNLCDKQLNFSEKQVEFTFDEYIELVKPAEQIVLVPADTKLASKLSKKTLSISFENELAPNTTYTLYLNGAVKDLSEGNDSLMKFTFSTGKQMDSLRFHCSVYDAYSKALLPKVTVGLYEHWEDSKPRYFAQSNNQGLVSFEALKEGDYFVKSFIDLNQDGQIQKSEKQGYRFETLHIDTAYRDTLKMAISLPVQLDKVKNARVIPPGIIGLHLPAEKINAHIQLNQQMIDINRMIGVKEDSTFIAIGSLKDQDLALVIDTDTLLIRYTQKQQIAKVVIQAIEKEGFQDRLFFSCSDFIQNIDTSKIELRNISDSSVVPFKLNFLANLFEIQPLKACNSLKISISDGAIRGLTENKNANFQKEIQWKQEREYGDLTLLFTDTIAAGILQILKNSEVVRTVEIKELSRLVLPNLLPGEYTFKILLDRNKNGKWDPISPETKTLAEEVLLFNDSIKIRANWEVESTFEVRPKEKND